MTDPIATRQQRLDRYEQRSALPMVILALSYIVLFAVEVLATGLSASTLNVLTIISNAIWIVFVIDLVLRTYLAPRRGAYLLAHPIDVIAVVLPAFRAFRVLRVFTAGQWLLRDGTRLTYGRTGLATAAAVLMVVFLGALAVVDAEKGVAESNIDGLGSGLWFAFETVTTVGYGDTIPVTFQGRVVAVGLMILGISLVGIVSATLATGFLQRVQGEERARERADLEELEEMEQDFNTALMAKIDRLENQVAALTAALQARG